MIYLSINCLMLWLVASAVGRREELGQGATALVSLVAGLGPVVVAEALSWVTDTSSRPALYPFHRESLATTLLHLVVPLVVCILPVTATTHLLLTPPGHSLLHFLWGDGTL